MIRGVSHSGCASTSCSSPANQIGRQRTQRDDEPNKRTGIRSVRIGAEQRGLDTHIGVGLPKVLRRSPRTTFWGDRYNFSNSSGEMVILLAVLMVSSAAVCSAFGSTVWPAPLVKSFSRPPAPTPLFCAAAMMIAFDMFYRTGGIYARVCRVKWGEQRLAATELSCS